MSLAGNPTVGAAPQRRAVELANAALRDTERGAYDSALALYAEAAKLAPDNADILFNYASLARITGALAQAEELLHKVVKLRPTDAAAWLMLSGLRRWSRGENHIAALQRNLAQLTNAGGSPRQRVELLYALAKENEDLEDFQAAQSYLREGAALRRQHLRYDVQDDLATLAALRQLVKQMPVAPPANDVTTGGPTPIFIVSLPRAGSTLLERMLSTDPEVNAAGELPFFPQLVGRALQQAFIAEHGKQARPRSKAELVSYAAKVNWQEVGAAYRQALAKVTPDNATFAIDKMPMNYLNIGFLRQALPDARIIYLQRDPDDHALALLKHLFNEAYPWSYNEHEIDVYTAAVRELCESAHAQPKNEILKISYEALVQDPEASLVAVSDYCKLDWDAAAIERALHFNQTNQASSTTGSASQVRSALHARSIGLAGRYKEAKTDEKNSG